MNVLFLKYFKNKMSKLSGIKDIDREIMLRIDDKDLLKAPPEELLSTRVMHNYLGGERVFSR